MKIEDVEVFIRSGQIPDEEFRELFVQVMFTFAQAGHGKPASFRGMPMDLGTSRHKDDENKVLFLISNLPIFKVDLGEGTASYKGQEFPLSTKEVRVAKAIIKQFAYQSDKQKVSPCMKCDKDKCPIHGKTLHEIAEDEELQVKIALLKKLGICNAYNDEEKF